MGQKEEVANTMAVEITAVVANLMAEITVDGGKGN